MIKLFMYNDINWVNGAYICNVQLIGKIREEYKGLVSTAVFTPSRQCTQQDGWVNAAASSSLPSIAVYNSNKL